MAISGTAAADIVRIANALGESRQAIAAQLSYTYEAVTVGHADHGAGTKQLDLTFTNCPGVKTIDWEDGTITHTDGSSATHVYASTGTKHARVTGYGFTTRITQALAA